MFVIFGGFSCGEKNLCEIGIVSVRYSAERSLLSIPIKTGKQSKPAA